MYQTSTTVAQIPGGEYIRLYRDTEKFMAFCRQCECYGNCWACPPYDFDPEEYVSGYHTVFIIGTKIVPDEIIRNACIDPEKSKTTGKQILAEVRKVIDKKLLQLEQQYPGSKAFFAGTCFFCPAGECPRKKGEPCVHPDKVRPSLEAFGFDIGKTTAELLHMDLKWSRDARLPEYFTLVSGLFTPSADALDAITNTFKAD